MLQIPDIKNKDINHQALQISRSVSREKQGKTKSKEKGRFQSNRNNHKEGSQNFVSLQLYGVEWTLR